MDATLERGLRELAQLIASSPHNLVSRPERAEVYERHVLECLAYADELPLVAGSRWIDVGTGGGLPGLVLALARPEVQWLLVDSTRKKADAARDFAATLGLDNVVVVSERAETLAHDQALRGRFDGAISRAVAPLATLVELLAGFVRPGGALVAVKGPRWEDELAAARIACRTLGLRDDRVVHIPSAARPTWLVMMRREGVLPAEFPRRPGIPRSHPLGGS